MTPAPESPEGIVLIDKPGGITSHDAVEAVRRALGTKKVGHAGTLDPMATGLLILGVGRATRLLRFLGDQPKVYEGTMRLGIRTATLDADGEVRSQVEPDVSSDDVRAAMSALVGRSMQVPPAYSAVKVGGRKLYEAARRGEPITAEARPIVVDAFELRSWHPDDASAGFRVICGGGTYVRVLAADVGDRLGCGAHLVSLRRTAIGAFDVTDAVTPYEPGTPLPLARTVAHLPSVTLDVEEAVAAAHGRILGPTGLAGPYTVVDPDGRLVGVYRDDGTKGRPEVILAPAPLAGP